MKKFILVLLVVAALLALIFFAGRYGWRCMSFRACQSAGIESVEVSGEAVSINGFYPGSFPSGFIGCHYREIGDTLYVGFRFSAVFGFFETGDFAVTIPTKGEIERVVIKTADSERTVWSKSAS